MKNLLKLSDASGRHLAVLSLPEDELTKSAIDLVFDVIGSDAPETLVRDGILAEGQIADFKALQKMIFDQDDKGMFIRDDVYFKANGTELNPDSPIKKVFVIAQKEDMEYRRCELLVFGGLAVQENAELPTSTVVPESEGQRVTIDELASLMFLHQIAIGKQVDVTKDLPELTGVVSRAEKSELIEIDVKAAAYRLTEKGKRRHASFIEEAQTLIRKYDIYSDVDLDSAGVHFDTGLGQDLRVPVFEKEGVDPFRARFLLGINDGEWDQMQNWIDVMEDPKWYDEIFKPIERAPSIDEIGEAKLDFVIEQGKAKLRSISF